MSSPTSTSQLPPPEDSHAASDDDHQGKQQCPCCLEYKPPSQITKFTTCPTKPCNKTCKFCWTKHVKVQIIEQPLQHVPCFICNIPLTTEDIKKCFTKHDRDHYEWKLRISAGERPCSRVSSSEDRTSRACRGMQTVNDDTDTRMATCNTCQAQDCIPCNSPEHPNETCSAYQARLNTTHGADLKATTLAFQQGYTATEEIGTQGNTGVKTKTPTPCPGCGVQIERKEKCPRVRCLLCNMEFCTRPGCGAKYLGSGSVPEKGNAAHAESCAHSKRQKEDKRFKQVKKVKGDGEEGEGPGSGKKRKASAGGDESSSSAPVKKRKAMSKDKVVESDAEDEAEADPEQSAEAPSPQPAKPRKRAKKAAGEESRSKTMTPETKAKREKQALRREKRKGIEQKKREMENPSAEMLAAWEEQFGSAAT